VNEQIRRILNEAAAVHRALADEPGPIAGAVRLICQRLRAGGSLYVMGNGGSAADAQHLAGELVGRFLMERRALPCLALTTDSSVLTALANDYGPEEAFRRQVEAFVGPGDAVMGISTSGGSANVNRALAEARRRGAATIGLTGADGGGMAPLCDALVRVDADATPRIQEAHQTIIHIVCALVEQELCGEQGEQGQ
jgi:D-sedoheptulose 7-phosphate isomerase